MSTAILTVAVLLACALAWRRHHWHVQRERFLAAFAVLTKTMTESINDAIHHIGEQFAAATVSMNAAFARFADAMPGLVSSPGDQYAHDLAPDRCWRCDASPSTDDLGLCEPCRASLTRGTA